MLCLMLHCKLLITLNKTHCYECYAKKQGITFLLYAWAALHMKKENPAYSVLFLKTRNNITIQIKIATHRTFAEPLCVLHCYTYP